MSTVLTTGYTKVPNEILESIKLSARAKVTFEYFLRLFEVSKLNPDNFSDEHGVFICFSRKSLKEKLNCCQNTVKKVIDELINAKLIFEIRRGQGKVNKIYVKDFFGFKKSQKASSNVAINQSSTSQPLSSNPTSDSEVIDVQQISDVSDSSTPSTVQQPSHSTNNSETIKTQQIIPPTNKLEVKNNMTNQQTHSTLSSQTVTHDLTLFLNTWTYVTDKTILLDAHQTKQLNELITKYSYDYVLDAVHKIEESHYLMEHINLTYFISYFEKIYNDTYKDRKQFNPSVVKKTRFNMINSRDWDWEELDRLEEKRLDRIEAEYLASLEAEH